MKNMFGVRLSRQSVSGVERTRSNRPQFAQQHAIVVEEDALEKEPWDHTEATGFVGSV